MIQYEECVFFRKTLGTERIDDAGNSLINRYILLTGSKNNAGDFLIKFRAKCLLDTLRPDRTYIDYDAWHPLKEKQLQEVNDSRALILLGGPALQFNMYPDIYSLVPDLTDIKVPVISMGIGWKSSQGNWEDTHNYYMSENSTALLRKIEDSGYLSSVRDYHTQQVLHNLGFDSFLVTGCPALFSLDHIGEGSSIVKKTQKVSFSMGVAFVSSSSMEQSVKEIISALHKHLSGVEFEVVFHHSIDKEKYLNVHNCQLSFFEKHQDMIRWLDANDITYVDISGSAERMIDYYEGVDLHIGFRVHAHIFMNSISKPSFLLSEDGRGKGLKEVVGGVILDGFDRFSNPLYKKVLKRIVPGVDYFRTFAHLAEDVVSILSYEEKNSHIRSSMIRAAIDKHFLVMKQFLAQLP